MEYFKGDIVLIKFGHGHVKAKITEIHENKYYKYKHLDALPMFRYTHYDTNFRIVALIKRKKVKIPENP